MRHRGEGAWCAALSVADPVSRAFHGQRILADQGGLRLHKEQP